MQNLELFADLPVPPARAPQVWIGGGASFGRNTEWTHPQFPGVVIRHCGHPTANYPYYIEGMPALFGKTFRRLQVAQAAVAAGKYEPHWRMS